MKNPGKPVAFVTSNQSVALRLLVCCVFLCVASVVDAHTIVLSEYSLEYKKKHWILSFTQKTSQLRDAIYSWQPQLKGINLNSEAFHEATAAYVNRNFRLSEDDEILFVRPEHMHYGGLRFESTFVVEELSEAPDYLGIEVDGFDAHEHSIILCRIVIGDEAHLHYFNRNEKQATFDFNTQHYSKQVIQSSSKTSWVYYAILLLGVAGVTIWLFMARRRNEASA